MNKKIIALFLVVFFVCGLCGCMSPVSSKFEPLKVCSGTAHAKKGDFSFTCNVECRSYEDTRIEFTSPESLKGLSLSLSSEGISVSAYGLKDSFSSDFIVKSSPVYVLLHGVRDGIFLSHDFSENGDGTFSTDVRVGDTTVRVLFNRYGELIRLDDFAHGFSAELESTDKIPAANRNTFTD